MANSFSFRRERCGLLYEFEATDESRKEIKLVADVRRTITAYQRSAAGTEWDAKKIRTPSALRTTVRYIMDNIISQETTDGHNRRNIYEFVFDRLRQIRQEMIIQDTPDDIKREILESCTVFFIVSSYKLTDLEGSLFDAKDNIAHIYIVLTQLIEIYDLLDRIDAEWCHIRPRQFKRRCLIESVNILFNLQEDTNLLRYRDLPSDIKENEYVKQAVEISRYHIAHNYFAILRRTTHLHYLQFCALSRFIPQFQAECLARLNVAMAVPQPMNKPPAFGFPIKNLGQILFPFADQEWSALKYAGRICGKINLPVTRDRAVQQRHVIFSKNFEIRLQEAADLMPRRLWSEIPSKRWVDVIDELFRNPDVIAHHGEPQVTGQGARRIEELIRNSLEQQDEQEDEQEDKDQGGENVVPEDEDQDDDPWNG